MTDTTSLHMNQRDQALIRIGRLQVLIENCEARIAAAGTEAEAAIPQSSMELYKKLLQYEIRTLPE